METRDVCDEAVVVKNEPQWEESLGSCGVSEAAARAGLYCDHEVKDELVIGPDEASWCNSAASCGVSEAAARAGLYTGHEVKDELVVGPECLQLPDVAYSLNAASQQPVTEGGSEQEPGSERTRSSEQPLLTNCFVKLERISVHKMLMFPGTGCHEANLTEHYEEVHDMEEEKDIYSMSVVGTEDNTLVCAICKARFTLKAHLLEHVMEHIHMPTSVEQGGSWDVADSEECDLSVVAARDCAAVCRYQCDVCGKAYAQRRSLIRHIRGHEVKSEQGPKTPKGTVPKPYSCGKCGRQFATNSGLFYHKKTYPRKKPLSCAICDIQFGDICEYVNHKTHISENRYFCKLCNKTFNCLAYLKKHTLTHSSVKPYSCKICGKKFFAPSILKIHTRKHTGAKPYKCEICKKKFPYAHSLLSHKRIHTGEKPYSCEVCHKPFSDLPNLKRHKRIHTGEKPYSCDLCNKKYRQSQSLKIHKLTHTKLKQFACEECGRKFTKLTHLKSHKRVHTGVRPYSCEICERKFTHLNAVKRHTKLHK